MNLIEQLGGYEKAKKIWDLRPEPNDSGYIKYYSLSENQFFDEYAYEWCQIKKDWYETMKSTNNLNLISVRDLGLELLEYRRQHNIFEEGDSIVFDISKPFCAKLQSDLMKVINPKYQEHDMIVRIDNQIYIVGGKSVRHATDAEIQAGRRL